MSDLPGGNKFVVSKDDARKAEPVVREPDQLALEELRNSHARDMNKNQRGAIGWMFGSGLEKSGNAAILSIVVFLALIVCAFFKFDLSKDSDAFYKLLTTLLGPIGLALGYLFGSKKSD